MGLTRVGGEKARSSFFPTGWNVAAKPCDYCKSAAALLFCSADSAFMCIKCDAKVHNADRDIAHAKVWMCEVCEQAPAAVTCKADAASLCITCDCDIHSVNPLAQRHDRVALVPFYNTAESTVLKSTAVFDAPATDSIADWYFPDSWSSTKLAAEMKSMEFLFPNSNQFLDFDSYRICSQPYSDSVVTVQTTVKQPPPSAQLPENRFEIDFTKSDITSYSHSVSSSSTDVGLVPDGSETSYPFTVSSITDPIANHGMDRKARVLRYREKRKNRKFDKTIRYVSRKAYAEVRPRIKGRFAKRTDSDGMLGFDSGNLIGDPSYGAVPSF